jgi:hypothetical protein
MDFWNKSFNSNDDDSKEKKNRNYIVNGDDDDDEDLPAGTTVLLKIPVKQLKPGGLRLFLMFYLLGVQNTPERNSWKANQPVLGSSLSPSAKIKDDDDDETTTTEAYVLEMFYKDGTGMIQVELMENEILVYRCGSVPSTQYLMQESVIVDGILDELHQCAFDETISESDRLLIPDPTNAIDMARETLAFG